MGQNYSILIGTGAALLGAIIMWKKLKYSKISDNKIALIDSNAKYPFKLVAKEILTHDTRRFRFALPSNEHVSGLPVGNHITLSAKINGELVVRPYTPVSLEDDKGYFEIILKIYYKNVNSAFPNGGKMSQYIDSLKIGDCIDVRGPLGRLRYLKNGIFEIINDKKKPPHTKKINKLGMIAGGSGITPMFQLIKEICRRPDDQTKIQLIFSNTSENDILLKDELDSLVENSLEKLKIWYTVSKPVDPNWKFGIGRINEDMLSNHLPSPNDDALILICGPKGMDAKATDCLNKLGYTNEMIHRF